MKYEILACFYYLEFLYDICVYIYFFFFFFSMSLIYIHQIIIFLIYVNFMYQLDYFIEGHRVISSI